MTWMRWPWCCLRDAMSYQHWDNICTCMPTSQTDACILCFSPPLAAGVDITAQLSSVIGLAYLQCTAATLMHRRKAYREQQYLCERS